MELFIEYAVGSDNQLQIPISRCSGSISATKSKRIDGIVPSIFELMKFYHYLSSREHSGVVIRI